MRSGSKTFVTSTNDKYKNDKDETKVKLVSLFNLLKFTSTSDKLLLFLGSIGAIVCGAAWPVLNILFGDVVDLFVEYEQQVDHNSTDTNTTIDDFLTQTYYLSGSLFVMGVVYLFTNFLLIVCFSRAATNQIHVIRVKYFDSVLKQEISWYDSRPSGDFASRVSADLKRIEDGIGEKLGFALYHTSNALLNLIIAFIYGWELTLVVLAMAPLLAASTGVMTKVQATFARKETESYASAGTVAEEVISSIRTVFSFGGEAKECDRYESNLKPAMKSGIRRSVLTGLGTGVMWLCLYSGFALGVWYGVKLIIRSDERSNELYSIGTMVIVFWCVTTCGWNLGFIAPHLEAIQIARGTAQTVYDIIKRKPRIDVSAESGAKIEKMEARVEFRNIDFSYPLRPEVTILQNFNLSIKSGETVALVGPSGCGKSTIVQLLQRFYDTLSGDVLIDGHNIRDLNVGWIRQQIGVVGQEPVLFDTTIAENICLGSKRDGITSADIEAAALEANCHEFIDKLPLKYETYVGDRGAQLSGGQKQRIAIARALISKPKLLLLDEATSALDLKSEQLVQTALDSASKSRTTIIIAHRLSTIVNSDRIIFIENGSVVESGTHKALMAKEGAYYRLVMAQKSKPKSDEDDNKSLFEEEVFRRSTTVNSDPNSLYGKDDKKVESEEEILKEFSQMRLLRLLWADKSYVFVGLICSTLFGLVVPAYAFIFGSLVEEFAENKGNNELAEVSVKYALFFVGLAVATCFCSTLQISAFGVASERLTMRLRKMAFSSVLRQEIGWFDRSDNSTGSLCSRLSSDAANIQGASGSRMAVISSSISTFLASAVFGFVFNWKLSLVTLAFMPLIILSMIFATKITATHSTSDKEAVEKASKIAIEAIGAIRTVVSLNQEKYFAQKYNQVLAEKIDAAKRRCFWNGLGLGLAKSIPLISYAAAFLYGGYLVSKGGIKSGDFFKIIETMIYGSVVVGESAIFTADYQKAKISAQNIFRLIDRKPDNQLNNNSDKQKPNECSGDLSFRGIHFTYPNRPEVPVLNGLSFKAKKGETVALVGSSGCGKSTSIQLLERFYDCTKGEILLDGQNINNVDIEWYRSQMALVSQEPILFSYSIRDNIAYGDNTRFVPMDEIVAAANKANIHQFVKDLPLGYDTPVGSKGAQLSGGQKQRIAIARALVRDPKILLLDEATSALDTTSEKLVQQALDEASKGRTCLVIAHRLTTVQNADKIIVLQKGVAIEVGRHHELLERNGAYSQLYTIQTE